MKAKTQLFRDPALSSRLASRFLYDVAAYGRIVMVDAVDEEPTPTSIHVFGNWAYTFAS